MPTPSLLIVPARFKTGRLYSQIPVPVAPSTSSVGDFTVTRNTEARRFDSAGLIASVASGIPRLDYYTSGGVTGCPALLVEPSAQNLALQSRDLSQAVWVKTNVTATKNAVGADGSVSGATTLTATAASGTVLQAIVNISQSRVFSAYVRRVSGTGAIQMTTNGGTNWTTVSISSIYTQVACAAQTVLNGSVGFRMAASGDVIEVDYTQGEVGPVATSPIPTTTGTGSRSADVISVSGAVSGSIGQTEGTIYAEVDVRNLGLSRPFIYLQDSSYAANAIRIESASNNEWRIFFRAGSATVLDVQPASFTRGVYKFALAYNSAASGVVFAVNGSVIYTSTTGITLPTGLDRVMLGTRFISGNFDLFMNDRIRAVALYNTRLSNSELAALTSP